MEPNPTPSSATPPNVGAPIVEYIRTQRQNAGSMLAVLSVLLLALTVYLALKAFRASAAADKPADQQQKENPLDPEKLQPPKPPAEGVDARRTDYMFGWLGTLCAFLAVGSVATWLLIAPPAPDEARQRTDARVAILALGAAIGTLAILFGIIFFYQWRDSLTGWLDRGEAKQARWVLIPILMIVAGAGVIFFAIQPARAEERNNAPIRRTVYWTNFGLTALLLLVAFIVANVLFSLKVPNKLDTTASGFYSISDNTRSLLTRLTEPVTAYAVRIEGQDRIPNDIRQLLLACQDASEGKFRVKFISDVANRDELNNLAHKYPKLEMALSERGPFGDDEDSGAVLLTAGSDEKRHAVIPTREFATRESGQPVFQGESRLFREVAFLADNQTKPVIYFTQGHQELDLTGGPDTPPDRSAARLKAYLEKDYRDVRPLTLPREKPSIPADADMVIVADPLAPLPEPAVGALRTYMNNPAKKGKLVVFVGAHAGPDRKMINTGLEPLLAELNVQLGTKFLYHMPIEYQIRPDHILASFTAGARQNPIRQAIARFSRFIQFGTPREVNSLTTSPAFQATSLMVSAPEMLTWLEDEPILDFAAVIKPMFQSADARRAKGLSDQPRSLVVTVSEGETARAAVFGNSFFASDEVARRTQAEASPLSFDLIGVTIDWLRERPSVAAAGVESKKYTQYRFPQPAAVDTMRILYLPLGLAFLCVLGLGAGVWVIRRR